MTTVRRACDFAAEDAELRARVRDADGWQAVHGLRALHERWGRSLIGARAARPYIATAARARARAGVAAEAAAEAEKHLAEAERWQRQIGSYATGSGEGLVSMGEVRELQLAQAWLAAALARATGEAVHARRARALAAKVEADTNGMGAPHARSLRELRGWLDRR